MIDTHCHPNMNKKKSREKILLDFFNEGGKGIIAIGTNLETSKEVLNLAKTNEKIYATIGVHPCDVETLDLLETIKKLEKMYLENKEKIVAIGEIGLDYYWVKKDAEKLLNEGKIKDKNKYIENIKKLQEIFFRAQIKLAKTYNLPFVIHNRDAKDEVFEILKSENYKNFVFHCYSENQEFAKQILDFAPDSMISFSGIVTFKNASEVQKTAKNICEKNILAETDAPFLTPTPFRGKEENEPKFTKFVIEKISELRGKDMSEIILKNSKRFFGI